MNFPEIFLIYSLANKERIPDFKKKCAFEERKNEREGEVETPNNIDEPYSLW